MTINQFETILSLMKRHLKEFENEDIYDKEKVKTTSFGKNFYIIEIECILDEISKLSKWIEEYKNELVGNIEIGQNVLK